MYEGALQVAYELWESSGEMQYIEKAFTIAEKSKAAILMDALRHNEARKFGGVPEELLQEEADLNRSIAFYSEYLYEEKKQPQPDSAKIVLWEGSLFTLNRKYDELIKLFNSTYPDYYSLKYRNEVIKPEIIQRELSKNTALIVITNV